MQMLVKVVSSGWLFLACFIAFVAYVGIARPTWFGKFLMLCGTRRGYDDPFYYFKRWTWIKPPHNWRSEMLQCILWMTVFGALAFYFVFTMSEQKPWGYIAVPGLMSIHFLVCAVRIYLRVKRSNAD